MSISSVFKSITTSIGVILAYFISEADSFIYALIALMTADYITGLMCAVVKKELSSSIGFKGIFRKICIFFLLGIGHILDILVLGEINIIRTVIIVFYIANESISIIENTAFLGLPIPKSLVKTLQQLKKKENGADEK